MDSGNRTTGYVIENNLFWNNQRAWNLTTVFGGIVRNNTIVVTDYPRPNSAEKACGFMHALHSMRFSNNVCFINLATNETVMPWNVYDRMVSATWLNNAFYIRGVRTWIWDGQAKSDFISTWKAESGAINGITAYVTKDDASEPGFVSLTDFHLLSSSPLRGTGNIADCPSVDLDGNSRVSCDIGAYAFGGTPPAPTLIPAPTPTPTPTPTPPPQTTSGIFNVGGRVQTNKTANIRSTASQSGILLQTVTAGFSGTVIGGPVSTSDGIIWWQINFDTVLDGWIGQDALSLISPAVIPGDINRDGTVNSIDWGLMNSSWLTNNASADLNSDGTVNSIDFSIMNANWLRTN